VYQYVYQYVSATQADAYRKYCHYLRDFGDLCSDHGDRFLAAIACTLGVL
jgi:hypothetical protein